MVMSGRCLHFMGRLPEIIIWLVSYVARAGLEPTPDQKLGCHDIQTVIRVYPPNYVSTRPPFSAFLVINILMHIVLKNALTFPIKGMVKLNDNLKQSFIEKINLNN